MAKKKLPITPKSQVKNALRQLSLRCRERNQAMKNAKRTCRCGAKASVARGKVVKVEGHHKVQPNWERIVQVIREELLVPPEEWEILCVDCHKKESEGQRDVRRRLKERETDRTSCSS